MPLTGPRRAQDATRQKPQSGRPGRPLDYRGSLPLYSRGSDPQSPGAPELAASAVTSAPVAEVGGRRTPRETPSFGAGVTLAPLEGARVTRARMTGADVWGRGDPGPARRGQGYPHPDRSAPVKPLCLDSYISGQLYFWRVRGSGRATPAAHPRSAPRRGADGRRPGVGPGPQPARGVQAPAGAAPGGPGRGTSRRPAAPVPAADRAAPGDR